MPEWNVLSLVTATDVVTVFAIGHWKGDEKEGNMDFLPT